MATFLPRYGLAEDPYDPQRELDPFSSKKDATLLEGLLAKVAEFKQIDDVDTFLKKDVKEGRPAFFLITGTDGCGRSSVADHVLARYRQCLCGGGDGLVVPEERETGNYNHVKILSDWMANLKRELYRRRLISQTERDDIQDSIEKVTQENIESKLGDVAEEICNWLAGKDPAMRYGMCLENVLSPDVVTSAFNIFQHTATVCVFTVGDYADDRKKVIDAFRDDPARVARIRVMLGPLSGPVVATVVDERWKSASFTVPGQVDNPFDLEGIKDAFSYKPWAVKKAMILVRLMLDLKATQNPVGKSWPEKNPKLWFEKQELPPLVEYFERFISTLR